MSESETPSTVSKTKFLKPLLLVAMILAVAWYFSQGNPSFPESQAGETIYDLQLTPL